MTLTPLDPGEQDLLRKTMGVRCRQARERLGLSQRALARAMERSPSWVREVEAGDQFPPAYLIAVLARATALPVGWFYGETEPDLEALTRRVLERIQVDSSRERRPIFVEPSSAPAAPSSVS